MAKVITTPNLSLYTTTSSSSRPLVFHSSINPRNPNTKSLKLKFEVLASSKRSNDEECWFREEQRWLREEQRWLREETRWRAERETLLRQISELKSKNNNIGESSIGRIAESGSSASEMVLETTVGNNINKDDDSKTKSAQNDVAIIAESSASSPMLLETNKDDAIKTMSVKLKKGLQGEDVRLMQEALLKLGFYSGEEDMEYSTFSTGTERAVKTWQASLDLSEDGVMTVDLLQILYEGANGTQKSQPPVKAKPIPQVDVTKPRVFLLGENRWEEPSRLIARNNTPTPKCPACQGQGRILCMECDGTGEPNIEEQFMEWVDEGTKCPYCDGLGEVTCDLCGVKTTI